MEPKAGTFLKQIVCYFISLKIIELLTENEMAENFEL